MVLNVPNATWGTPDNYWTNNGYEIKLMSLVAQILKVKIQFYYSDEPQNYGGVYMNGTAKGDLKKLQDNIDDVSFGGYSKNLERSFHFYTIIDHYDKYHVCVPHILISNKLQKIIKIGNTGSVSFVLTVSLVVFVALWYCSGQEPVNSYYTSLVNCLQIAFLLHFALPIPKYPKSWNLRMIVVFFSTYSFFINVAFQTVFISVLTSNSQQKTIKDIDDLVQNSHKLFHQDYFQFDFMKNYGETNAIREYIRKNEQVCADVKKCLNQIVEEKNAGIVLTESYAHYIVKDFLNHQREPLFYCFRETIVMLPQVIVVRRNFVLRDKIELIIKRIIQAGLDVKWKRDIHFLSKIRNDKKTGGDKRQRDDDEEQCGKRYLNAETFRVFFLFWVGACGIGIFVFVSEVVLVKWKKSKSKQTEIIISSPTKFQPWFKALFDHNIINAIILSPNRTTNTSSIEIFSSFPYSKGYCGTIHENKTINLIDSCRSGLFQNHAKWFPEKLPRKFNKCLFKVRVTEHPPAVLRLRNNTIVSSDDNNFSLGLDVDLLNLIATRLNIRLLYTSSHESLNFGDVLPNGTITGNLYYLHKNHQDICLGGYGLTLSRHKTFENAVMYLTTLHWCVPSSRVFRNIENFKHIIHTSAYVMIFSIYFVLTVTIWYFQEKMNLSESFVKSLSILLSLPVQLSRYARRSAARFFLFLLIVFSFYFTTSYQTILTSVLAKVEFDEELNTFEDILGSDLKLRGAPTFIRYLVRPGALPRWQGCSNFYSCIQDVAVQRNSAMLTTQLFIKYLLPSNHHQSDTPVFCFENPEESFLAILMMRKGFLLNERINTALMKITSFGFLTKLKRRIFSMNNANLTVGAPSSDVEDNPGVLNFHSLRVVFLLWSLGCAVASSAFILELIYFRI